jgi:hypothetical protein
LHRPSAVVDLGSVSNLNMAVSIMMRPRINVVGHIEDEGVIGIGEFGVYGARPNGEYVAAALPVLAVCWW